MQQKKPTQKPHNPKNPPSKAKTNQTKTERKQQQKPRTHTHAHTKKTKIAISPYENIENIYDIASCCSS